MTAHGLEHVEAAKADGRWHRAYRSGRDMKIPRDLSRPRIDAEPKAKAGAGEAHRAESLRARLPHPQHGAEAGRKKKDRQAFVEMLKRGETASIRRSGDLPRAAACARSRVSGTACDRRPASGP